MAKEITQDRENLHLRLHQLQNRTISDTLKRIGKRTLPESQSSNKRQRATTSSTTRHNITTHDNTTATDHESPQRSQTKAQVSELLEWIAAYKNLDTDVDKLLSLVDYL